MSVAQSALACWACTRLARALGVYSETNAPGAPDRRQRARWSIRTRLARSERGARLYPAAYEHFGQQ